MAEVGAAAGQPLPDWAEDFLKRLKELLRRSRTLLALQLLALWPVWRWYGARMTDGSDDPLGVLALALALGLVFRRRRELLRQPRGWPVPAAGLLTLGQAIAPGLPPLLRAILGMMALSLCLAASLPRPREAVALGALLLLSLPLVASLQFYAGYPLRLLAADGASLLLQGMGLPAQAEGAALRWGERLMLVDAPCSGIHMLWVGLVAAAAASAWNRARPVPLLRNLGLALALVLIGNVIRNAALFFKETGLVELPDWTHEGIGLALFALVVVPVALLCQRPDGTAASGGGKLPDPISPRGPLQLAAALFLAAAVAGTAAPAPPAEPVEADPDWWEALPPQGLIRLALTPQDQNWLRHFPGAVARFGDGRREWLVRHVETPTRSLHPAADCFRAMGYEVTAAKVHELDGIRWGCFHATGPSGSRQVCERILDSRGRAWTDVSAWYWDAVLGRTQGPWWAVTMAER
ncbi:MAG: exosortase/archaeosortase family protein [Methylococcaceae bacterium]|nr:exosortase/archaeosortase family protein [Methylococcaceae bacterium]